MNHVAAGVVEDAQLEGPAAAPQAVGADAVAEGQPQGHEQHPGAEVHAAQEAARGQDEGDDGEDELEVDHGGLGEVLGEVGAGQGRLLQLVAHARHGVGYAGDGQHVSSECDLVAPQNPADQDHGEGIEDLGFGLRPSAQELDKIKHELVDSPSS